MLLTVWCFKLELGSHTTQLTTFPFQFGFQIFPIVTVLFITGELEKAAALLLEVRCWIT